MKIDDITLLNYVEKRLSDEEIETVRMAAMHDDEIMQRIKHFQASELPFETAFQSEILPEVPKDLTRFLNELEASHVHTENTLLAKSRGLQLAAGIAAAFCLGWLASLQISPSDLIYNSSIETSNEANTSLNALSAYGGQEIIDSMMTYQRLYAEETIANSSSNAQTQAMVIARFDQDSERTLTVFSAPALTLRRVQNLKLGKKPIAQAVYSIQPSLNGDMLATPIAICATPVIEQSKPPIEYSLNDMNAVIWVSDGISYALMGKQSLKDLDEIKRKLTYLKT
ncbi:MAG: hypothetical protein KTR16_05535 [Acidiferrobacterales bacterium]|nr:hypothetical protein [Acidiferrobacterales bacterium]